MRQPGSQMREPACFVLASLLDGPLHGYAMIRRTEQLSGGRFLLATGRGRRQAAGGAARKTSPA